MAGKSENYSGNPTFETRGKIYISPILDEKKLTLISIYKE